MIQPVNSWIEQSVVTFVGPNPAWTDSGKEGQLNKIITCVNVHV